MSTEDLPQIYLVTPSVIDLEHYPDQLARVLDSVEVACLRLGLASSDEDHIARTADALRDVAHARDIMLVIERHALLVGQGRLAVLELSPPGLVALPAWMASFLQTVVFQLVLLMMWLMAI